MTRLLTAAFLIPAAWYLCKRAPLALFLAAAVLFAGIAAWECVSILKHRGARPFTGLAVSACVGIVFSFSLQPPLAVAVGVLTAAALLSPALAMARRASPEAMFEATMSTFFPVPCVGLSVSFVVGLRVIPGTDGLDLLLLAMLCVTLSDAGAYYVGSAFGAHSLAPVISPKKSWEGVAGGVLGSIGGALIGHFWFFQRLPLAHAVILGIVLCAAGILGDLAESMLKRSAGVKDSSALLPGHGGVLDRMDSLLVAAPVLYYYWGLFLAGAR